MKKIYTLFASLFVAIVCFGQSQRLVLFEEFTQASCPPCASTNPALNVLLNNNAAKIVSIKYQVSWPGYDPMYLQNTTEVNSRVSFYNVTGAPNGVEDGNQFNAQPASFTQTMINNRYAMPSPFTFAVTHSFSPTHDSIYVHADVTCTQAVSATTYARFAVIERNIWWCSPPGSNGETDFEGVMKKMLPGATGTLMPATINAGDQFTYDFAWKLTNVYDKNQLAVVGFIQNNTSKEVYQAAFSSPQQLADDARITCAGINVPTVNCSSTVTPSLEFANLGSNTLTALTISYQLDAGLAQTYNWSGSVAPGATAIATLTPQTVSAGSHSLTATVSSPNNMPDVNTHYDNTSRTFSVTASTGTPLPLIQDFVATTFPPTNWLRINPDNGATWTRVTAGNVTTGSAKIDFYSSALGQIDELMTPGYDFSGSIVTASLDFDVAYCQYSNENDRIQVQLSTDCGVTWTDVWNKSGSQLAFGNPPVGTSAWTPISAAQWHHQTVSLNSYVGNPNIFIKYKATSAFGNNGYIDNINVSVTTGIKENTLSEHVNVYPVPSNGIVNVDVKFETAQNLKVTVYNLIGEVVNEFEIAKTVGGLFPFDLSKVAGGSYTVKISTDTETIVKSINIVK
ncbi:MAG: T9SS type A sorting domain-containing protein [Bacteroidia bacterium]